MLPIPAKFTLTAGASEGASSLNAFDQALLAAGAGNVNLIRVSSILPPKAEFTTQIILPPGAIVPVAYGKLTSNVPETKIAAAVAVGIPKEGFGVIMEYSGYTSGEEAEKIIFGMVEEAFYNRKIKINQYLVKSIEHRVVKIGAVFAGVILWY